ncbi:MAG: penicillin-binding transpeptidase domain-containing protein [Elusimicrobiota bacterium]
MKLACRTAALLLPLVLSVAARAAEPDFKKIFGDKDGCFILYDLKAGKTLTEYNKTACAERVFACSTFKVPLALMAFDRGLLKDENTPIKWDGFDRKNKDWNRDQTPKSWLKYSAVWVSQRLTPKIGMPKIEKYLADFHYGNQDMSGGITKAWLSSTLKISAEEQIEFFQRFWTGRLKVSPKAVDLTKKSMNAETDDSGSILTGKTGSGFLGARDSPKGQRVGWFVGHLSHGSDEYVFALNFRGTNPSGPAGEAAHSLTKKILGDMGLF